MKFIDLFSGIGGFRSALEMNGHECIAYSEIDEYSIQSYRAIYNTDNETELGDITSISQEYLTQFRKSNDIVVGGSPCQSFSLSGRRRGFEDTRGTLFFEYAKVLKETNPRYFLYENVRGLLNHDKGETIKTILKVFKDLGYYVDMNIFNSKYYGVPQNRERVFIVGKRKDLVDKPIFHEKKTKKSKFNEVHNWAVDNVEYIDILPSIKDTINTKLTDLLEKEVSSRYYLYGEKFDNLVSHIDSENNQIAVREAVKKGYSLANVGDSVNFAYPKSKTRRGRIGRQISQTLEAENLNLGVVTDDLRIRKLTPIETWRLQGFTDEQFYRAKNNGVSDHQMYRQSGNAVTVNVVDYIIKHIIK